MCSTASINNITISNTNSSHGISFLSQSEKSLSTCKELKNMFALICVEIIQPKPVFVEASLCRCKVPSSIKRREVSFCRRCMARAQRLFRTVVCCNCRRFLLKSASEYGARCSVGSSNNFGRKSCNCSIILAENQKKQLLSSQRHKNDVTLTFRLPED